MPNKIAAIEAKLLMQCTFLAKAFCQLASKDLIAPEELLVALRQLQAKLRLG